MKSAEKILSELTDIPVYRIKADDVGEFITKSGTIKAMHDFAAQEAVEFFVWTMNAGRQYVNGMSPVELFKKFVEERKAK